MTFKNIYPFSAIVGQDNLKLLLTLNAINPKIGGVLIKGEKGTAKSTIVRALADLLPKINIIEHCPFNCSDSDGTGICRQCTRMSKCRKTTYRKKINIITLPLNATEDRVVGSIDFTATIKTGKRSFSPGLLANAHKGILYVDEVNLLDDHIVDIILDAAASGENHIEREGISFRHPSRFILIGTMNPEEGSLRPQFLDRFGLCIEIKAESDKNKRVKLMERRENFDNNPTDFIKKFKSENLLIAKSIKNAQERLKTIVLPRHMRSFISELCLKNAVAGHRADIILEQAARALAALNGRKIVNTEDIIKIAPFVFIHRTRDATEAPSSKQNKNESSDNTKDSTEENQSQQNNEQNQNNGENNNNSSGSSETNSEKGSQESDAQQDHMNSNENSEKKSEKRKQEITHNSKPADNPNNESNENSKEKSSIEQIFEIGLTFSVKKISSERDRIFRRGSGRRSRTMVSLKQGRYIKSTQRRTGSSDIALDATLRAAVCRKSQRIKKNGLAVVVTKEDIREKIREKRIGNFLLFLVDASGSMGAKGRMAASKGAIMSLLLDAYQKRDKVSMVSFRRDKAVVNLPPTSSVELAGKFLSEMPVGGRTPLSAGLTLAHKQIQNYFLRDPAARPIVIIITDGKTNVSMGGGKPVQEALELALKISGDQRISYIVVDTEESGPVNFKLAQRLAGSLKAQYFKIEELKADQLVKILNNRYGFNSI